jgi:hypothetical protein
VVSLPGRCAACDGEALRREHGGDTVWCELCEARWAYDDYTRFVMLMIGGLA